MQQMRSAHALISHSDFAVGEAKSTLLNSQDD